MKLLLDANLISRTRSPKAVSWVTADSDFSMMPALRSAKSPSVVLLRHVTDLPRSVLVANLPTVSRNLQAAAVVSWSPNRLAVRDLPIT